ncbi:MAG TPA: TspO/MBR family protein [Methylibium sp.]|nr:TspO/MBR family protein [Methylibium sp.]
MTVGARAWKPLLLAALAALAVAMLGGLMTDIGPWYRALVKPSWQPPDMLFGPVWTVIYALAALAAVHAWEAAPSRAAREWMLALFALNGFLNVLWSLLFFRLRRPDWALWEVGLLWLSVLALVVVLGRWSPRAGWLLAPYLAWVAFAAVLNLTIVRLNGPFGA